MHHQQSTVQQTSIGFVRVVLALALSTALIQPDLAAQPVPKSQEPGFRSRVVDLVILTDNTRLFGILAPEQKTRLLVRTDWLRQSVPHLFHPNLDACLKDAQRAENEQPVLQQKIEAEIQSAENSATPDRLVIQNLHEVLEQLKLKTDSPPKLVILELDPAIVRRKQSQVQQIQQLGFLAVINHVHDAERLNKQDAASALQSIPPGQLIRSIPGEPNEAENSDTVNQQVNAILTAIDLRTGKKSELIRSGNLFVPNDGEASLQSLIPQMMQQNMQKQLEDLLGEGNTSQAGSEGEPQLKSLPPSVIGTAKARNWSTVEITSFEIQIENGTAAVHKQLFHQTTSGDWSLIHSVTAVASDSELTEDQTDAVRNDPQVQSVMQIFQTLGTADSNLTRAILMGAVVKSAAASAAGQIQDFVSSSLRGEFQSSVLSPVPVIQIHSTPAPPAQNPK
ncbi:MAG: hypothetical protein JNL58_12435 [Planctomyces sp.]|nr:hypothetical protein [Planctomyces sp.]